MEKIIGMGNALVDVLARLYDDNTLNDMELPKGSMQLIDENKLQRINEKFSSMDTIMATGGSSANAIKALANLGVPTGLIGKIGKDEYGKFFDKTFREIGVCTQLALCELPSGVASTFISPDGERTFGTYLGAAAQLKPDDLQLEMFRGYSYLFIEGYLVQNHDLILRAVQLAKVERLQVCLDLASYNVVAQDRDFFIDLVTNYVDVVFANEEEAVAFAQLTPEASIDEIAKLCSIAVVKLGSKGSIVKKGDNVVRIDATPIENVVDTTGAGDYYAAGFLCGLVGGYSIRKCGRVGSLLAGYVIQSVGTTLPKEQWNEIKLKMQQIFNE